MAFSYYTDGNECIYTGNIEDKNVTQVTSSGAEEDHRKPRFSPEGESISYLSADTDGVQSLHYMPDLDSDGAMQLTDGDQHVFSAVIAPGGKTVYYIAMPAEDFLKPEGRGENGADLHAVKTDGTGHEKLTDKDAFNMADISISDDGGTLYYSDFQDVRQLTSYDLETETEETVLLENISDDIYHPAFSPGGEYLAYTAVDDESEKGTFIYELFLMDISNIDYRRLTDYNATVTSPVFFHQEDRIAFLAQSNWPSEPSVYEIMTIPYDGANMTPLALELPEAEDSFQPGMMADKLVNTATLTILYLLMFGLSIVYCHSSVRTYLPVIISAVITGMALVGSFIATLINPWLGIGLMALTLWLGGCTAVLLIFALIYKKSLKRSS
ncbi:TolB family protein [Salinicoccus sp. HZC-1]|uniref:TolB family protein n=1 Tax=Salinicoccus sp. HZC-1 TaxID=3385497 RepID=UPI00398B908C